MRKRIDLTAEAKYELLRNISYQIRDTLDLDKILNHLLDAVRTLIDYDAGGIFVLNQDIASTPYYRDEGMIAGIARRGYDERPAANDPMLSLGKGIVGYVTRTGESVVVPDVRLNEHYVEGRKPTRSEIAVPIIRNKRPIGALNLESDSLAAFDEKDIEILLFVADAASISIEKSMLHLQILEQKHLEDQLIIAEAVQAHMLPLGPPQVEGYDIAGLCIPTYDIGGDYFDYISLGNDKLGIVVADVSGNGIPAALLMASFRALFLPNARAQMSPPNLMRQVNALLPEFARKRDFVTAFYGILDSLHHTFTYTNCGHNLPLLARADGKLESLTRGGPSLSFMPDPVYDTETVTLHPGDLVLLFTDGVVEVFDRTREEFGNARLEELVVRLSRRPANEIAREIVHAIREFSGAEVFHDDFTLVVVKRC